MSNLISRHRHRSQPPGRFPWSPRLRALAALLCLLLAFGSVAPAWAAAGELDSEGEGAAPPGPVPGLEEGPEFEPGGEEAPLEEQAPLPGEEAEEEAPPVEVEAPAVPESTPPAAPEVEVAAPEAGPEAAASPVVEAQPPSAAPAYETEPGPAYETAPPPAAPVENEAVVAPPAPESRPRPHGEGSAAPALVEEPSPAPSEAPEPAPAPTPVPPAATPPRAPAAPGSLEGRGSHTVAPGECLWSIAAALLPPGASNARIAAEVQRLWKLNAARIGTGDPSLIYAGTVLRLR